MNFRAIKLDLGTVLLPSRDEESLSVPLFHDDLRPIHVPGPAFIGILSLWATYPKPFDPTELGKGDWKGGERVMAIKLSGEKEGLRVADFNGIDTDVGPWFDSS